MLEALLLLAGGIIGIVMGWTLGASRVKTALNAELRERDHRVTSAEVRLEEIRGQFKTVLGEFEATREKLQAVEAERAALEARMVEVRKSLADQRGLLEDARVKLSDTFKVLAAEALAGNTSGFLSLAEEKFKSLKQQAATDLEARQKAVGSLVHPIEEMLSAYRKEMHDQELKRGNEISAVGQQLHALAAAQSTLQSETARLGNALRSPQIRGRWGEITLRKTAELAGMVAHCDFVEQVTVSGDEKRFRPDMVVRLPAGREVVVDSKVPLEAFLESLEARTETDREAAMARYARHVSQHVDGLASKEYWDQFKASPEFVVMFIPNDSFLAAAAQKDPKIVERALARKVIIATPTTLIALLRAMAYGWRQEQVAEAAQRIGALGQELYDRMATLAEHLVKIGQGLSRAVDSYNQSVASLESRILPSARKFKTLGISDKKGIELLEPIGQSPRLQMPSEPAKKK